MSAPAAEPEPDAPDPVFQSHLPFAPWADPAARRLPGVMPLDPGDWLGVDDAYAGQMTLRDRLIAGRPWAMHALLPEGRAAADELLTLVLDRELPRLGFTAEGSVLRRPDGVPVRPDPAAPLLTLGRLVQEDFCLMQPGPEGEHILTGAILCFPAGWTLAEKLGRPLTRIHAPVAKYDAEVARRVRRLFDLVQPGRPLWRANAHRSAAPLHNPRPEGTAAYGGGTPPPFVRSERQCILRLPETGAVVISIHTWLVRAASLTPAQAEALDAHPIHSAA
ncbi:MAG: heme-dependent oxidative N-demethylase family protein [Paracoccaceae bacterium]